MGLVIISDDFRSLISQKRHIELVEAFTSVNGRQGLSICCIDIGSAGAKYLSEMLQLGGSPRCLRLDLSSNCIGSDGAKYFAEALQSGRCSYGLQLDLHNNQIGDAGAKDLAAALSSGSCRQGLQLKLGLNEIGSAGVEYLAEALWSGKCPFGLKIYGLGAKIESLCQKNDDRIRINFKKREALLSFITMAGDWRFPVSWFCQSLDPYLPGNNQVDALLASVSIIRKAREAGHQERPNVDVGHVREEATRCGVASCCVIS